jgi:hypothetical protein
VARIVARPEGAGSFPATQTICPGGKVTEETLTKTLTGGSVCNGTMTASMHDGHENLLRNVACDIVAVDKRRDSIDSRSAAITRQREPADTHNHELKRAVPQSRQ